MTTELNKPRNPYDKVGGLYYLGRCIDKIRYKKAGTLHPGYFDLMGKGFDARIMAFLEVDYQGFYDFVMPETTDEAAFDNLRPRARALNEQTILIWNDFASKRGWKDSGSEILARFKKESGLENRDDLVTLFDYWNVDEGRSP